MLRGIREKKERGVGWIRRLVKCEGKGEWDRRKEQGGGEGIRKLGR